LAQKTLLGLQFGLPCPKGILGLILGFLGHSWLPLVIPGKFLFLGIIIFYQILREILRINPKEPFPSGIILPHGHGPDLFG